jgi:nitrogenase molybdenum-iron protein alpha/beta subunit
MEHEDRAEQAEEQVEKLEDHSETVGDHIDEARRDLEQKEADTNVPGVQAPEEEEEGDRAGLDTAFDQEEDKQ